MSSAHMRMLNVHRSRQSLKDRLATKSDPSHVGLCLDCVHAKRVEGKEDTFTILKPSRSNCSGRDSTRRTRSVGFFMSDRFSRT